MSEVGRVAIAHDYLTQRGGAERVVLSMLRAFPDAKLYTSLYDPQGTFPEFRDARIITSPLNRVRLLRRNHRLALPLLPWAISQLPVDADVVLASSSGWAHGMPSRGRTLVYCHNPARWLYQTEEYLGRDPNTSVAGRLLLRAVPRLQAWDRRAAEGADRYLANSSVVQERIQRTYDITAPIVFPPHGIDESGSVAPVDALDDWSDGYHLIVSRLLPYKHVAEAISAFRELPERLVVVGRGPEESRLRAGLPGNVRIFSHLDDAQLRWAYAHATALLAPSKEDFGLTPLEAGAFGKPTLALRAGGYLDTVIDGVTGAFFDTPSPEAIRQAILRHRETTWDDAAIRSHVEAFDEPRFIERLRAEVSSLLATAPLVDQTR